MRLITAEEAVRATPDGATLIIGGSGAGHSLPQLFIDTLADVFRSEGAPKDLTTVRVVGIGDFADRGFSQLALPGLMRRTIGSNIGNEPRLGELVEQGLRILADAVPVAGDRVLGRGIDGGGVGGGFGVRVPILRAGDQRAQARHRPLASSTTVARPLSSSPAAPATLNA